MKKIIKIVLAVLIVLFTATGVYLSGNYEPTDSALSALNVSESNITITQSEKGIEYMAYGSDTTIIYYPGGLVDAECYCQYALALAQKGISVIICKMPFDLAVFNMNAAEYYYDKYPQTAHWYIAGHSLGGAMAASYLKENADKYEGLILLAAYSTSDLTDTDLKTLAIYGTNDEVMNREKYAKYYDNLPNLAEKIIEGGNHGNFGGYGQQKGDGIATITMQQQLEITVDAIVNFVNQ